MATITDDFVSFEVAKLLKEKGFDKFCDTGWDENLYDKKHARNFSFGFDKKENWISRPTHQMAMKWLMEVHNLFIEPYVVKNYSKKKLEYTYSIQDLDFQGSDDGIECCKNWDTPEQACETAIKYCLEHLI